MRSCLYDLHGNAQFPVVGGQYMKLLVMLFMTLLTLYLLIGSCRVLSMTFKTFCRSITIKSDRLAEMLIAYKNTWGIKTSADKRNKMSILGIISYIIFLPEIFLLAYDWWVFITTGVATHCTAEQTYFAFAVWYYIIALIVKINEANKFERGDIW